MKVWRRMNWTASLWLGQRTHPGNSANFTAAFAGKIRLSWHIEYTRSRATTRGPSTFHKVSVLLWKLRVGECLISRVIPWERKKLGGIEGGSWRLHKWWDIKNILLQKTLLWTVPVQLMWIFPCSPTFLLWLRHCIWSGATNWSINCGLSSQWLLGEWP